MVFNELPGKVSRVPSADYGPTDKVTFLAEGRRRGRRVEARFLKRDVDRTDLDKDQALIDAFSAAIAAAVGAEAA